MCRPFEVQAMAVRNSESARGGSLFFGGECCVTFRFLVLDPSVAASAGSEYVRASPIGRAGSFWSIVGESYNKRLQLTKALVTALAKNLISFATALQGQGRAKHPCS